MTSDLDIWRSANVLIKHYGEDAYFMAARCADAMLERGDMDGCRAWKRILKAIEEMERAEKTEAESLS
jgi:hypothetical protein